MADLQKEQTNLPPFPKEFRDLMIPLIREVVIEGPSDIPLYCAQYFERLLEERQNKEKETAKTLENEKLEKPDIEVKPDLEARKDKLPAGKSMLQVTASEPALTDDDDKIRNGKALRGTASCHETLPSATSLSTRRKTVRFNLEEPDLPSRQNTTCSVDLYQCDESETSSSQANDTDESAQLKQPENTEGYATLCQIVQQAKFEYEDFATQIAGNVDRVITDLTTPSQIYLENDNSGMILNDVVCPEFNERNICLEPSAPSEDITEELEPSMEVTDPEHVSCQSKSGRKKWSFEEVRHNFQLKSQSPEPDRESVESNNSLTEQLEVEDVKGKLSPNTSFGFMPHLLENQTKSDHVAIENNDLISNDVPNEDSKESNDPDFSSTEAEIQMNESQHYMSDYDLITYIDTLSNLLQNIATDIRATELQLGSKTFNYVTDTGFHIHNCSEEEDNQESCHSIECTENESKETIDLKDKTDGDSGVGEESQLDINEEDLDNRESNSMSEPSDAEPCSSTLNFDLTKEVDKEGPQITKKDCLLKEHMSQILKDYLNQMCISASDDPFKTTQAETAQLFLANDKGLVNDGFEGDEEDSPPSLNTRGGSFRNRRREGSLFENLPPRRPPRRRRRIHPSSRNVPEACHFNIGESGDAMFPVIDEMPERREQRDQVELREASPTDEAYDEIASRRLESDEIYDWMDDPRGDIASAIDDAFKLFAGPVGQRVRSNSPDNRFYDENLINQMRMNLAEFRLSQEENSVEEKQKQETTSNSTDKQELLPMSEGDGLQVQGNGTETGPCVYPHEDMSPSNEDLRMGVIGDGNQDAIVQGQDAQEARNDCLTNNVDVVPELNSAGGDHRPASPQDNECNMESVEVQEHDDEIHDVMILGETVSSIGDGESDCLPDLSDIAPELNSVSGDHRPESPKDDECNMESKMMQKYDNVIPEMTSLVETASSVVDSENDSLSDLSDDTPELQSVSGYHQLEGVKEDECNVESVEVQEHYSVISDASSLVKMASDIGEGESVCLVDLSENTELDSVSGGHRHESSQNEGNICSGSVEDAVEVVCCETAALSLNEQSSSDSQVQTTSVVDNGINVENESTTNEDSAYAKVDENSEDAYN